METKELYVLTLLLKDGTEKNVFCVGISNTKKAARILKKEYQIDIVYYNKAITCFDGYLAHGEYLGQL